MGETLRLDELTRFLEIRAFGHLLQQVCVPSVMLVLFFLFPLGVYDLLICEEYQLETLSSAELMAGEGYYSLEPLSIIILMCI